MKYSTYNSIRNTLYRNKVVLSVYAFFKNKIPNYYKRKKLMNNGFKDLTLLVHSLEDTDIQYFCDFGTLLGLIRDKGFISYDNDIDMGIISDSSFSWDKLEKHLASVNIKKIHSYNYNGRITEETYAFPDGLSVDFFLYDVAEDTMTTNVYYKNHSIVYDNANQRSVKKLIYPRINGITAISVNEGGASIPVPEDAEDHLEHIYGYKWRVPDPSYKPDRKNNILPNLGQRIDY